VYEVASVLALHPVQHMKVVPVFQIVVFCIACWFIWVFSILQMTLNMTVGFQELAYPFVAIVVGGGYAFVMRQWAHDRQAIRSRLSQFSVRNCICAVEADRAVVYSNIAMLVKTMEGMPMSASEDDALEAFDRQVRRDLPNAFCVALGRFTFQYKHYIVFGLFGDGFKLVDFLAGIARVGAGCRPGGRVRTVIAGHGHRGSGLGAIIPNRGRSQQWYD
jgi:hypothetical protein